MTVLMARWVEVRKVGKFWFRYDPARRLVHIKRGDVEAYIDLLEYDVLTQQDGDTIERLLTEELDRTRKERDRMLHALHISRGNVASLGPSGALQPYYCYREWLRMIDEAIGQEVKHGCE